MLDVGWQELLVIGALALIVVGPKDLPAMLRKFGQMVGRMRSMASDFQRAMNDAAREADISNIKELNEVRNTLSGSIDFDSPADTAQSYLNMDAIDEDAPKGAGPDDDPAGGPVTGSVDLSKPAGDAAAEPAADAADEAKPAKAAGT